MNTSDALRRFMQAKYGLFIHFGLYSLLGGEWQGRVTPGLAEWIQNDLDIPAVEYAQLASQFDPIHFDARQIARNAKRWGMRYICFTAKHHDGFALFDSAFSYFNSVQASPCKRDFVAELAEACAKEGIMLCLYYSQAQDWHHAGAYRAYHENDPKAFEAYFEGICLPQIRELLTKYGKIGMIWFDTPMGMSKVQSRQVRDLVRRLQADCLVNGRIGNALGDYLTMADNRIPRVALQHAWEVPVTLNSSWGFKRIDTAWQSSAETLEKLMKVVSRGGNMLLNVGPDGEGRVPAESQTVLEEIGAFIARHQEAFYDTQATPDYVFELEDVYFTQKPGIVYIYLLNPLKWAGRYLSLYHIASKARKATLVSTGEELTLKVGKDLEGFGHWAIRLPETVDEQDRLAWVIKVEIEGESFEVEALG